MNLPKMTTLRWLWVGFIVILAFHGLFAGVLVAIITLAYWQHKDRPKPRTRLSDTREIQLAFQQEMARIINESLNISKALTIPTEPSGIIDAQKLQQAMDDGTFRAALVKPELILAMKTLIFLLAQCSRLEATKQNLACFEPLFHPGHPITPTVADAYKECVEKLTGCIEPTKPVYAEVK